MVAAAAAAAAEQQEKIRWYELEEDDGVDLDFLHPLRGGIGPDDIGIRKVMDYRFDDEGKKIKFTATTGVRKLSRGAIQRPSWSKFDGAMKEDASSRFITMGSPEAIHLECAHTPGSKAEEPSASGSRLAMERKGDSALMVCGTCGKKDLATQNKSFVGRFPTADGPAEPSICQICMRPNDAMWRRNVEASVRVTNLPEDTRECDLINLFCPFGLIICADLAVDEKADSRSLFGIVEYGQREDAEEAISWLDGYKYDDRTLRVEWATPPPPICDCPAGRNGANVISCWDDDSSVRVTNLSEATSERDLVNLFCLFGLVTGVSVDVDEMAGQSRRYGIVEFGQREDAEEAISWLDGYKYDGLTLRVEWATPRWN